MTAMVPGEAAAFISDMAADLRNIASKAGLPLLTQLLEMVFTEALSLSNDRSQWVKKPAPRNELRRRQ